MKLHKGLADLATQQQVSLGKKHKSSDNHMMLYYYILCVLSVESGHALT